MMKILSGTVEALIHFYNCYESDTEGNDWLDPQNLTNHNSKKFHCVFSNLDKQVQHELVALFWIGDRLEKDFSPEDFPSLVDEAKSVSDDGDASYLFGKKKLVESWNKGMSLMGMNYKNRTIESTLLG